MTGTSPFAFSTSTAARGKVEVHVLALHRGPHLEDRQIGRGDVRLHRHPPTATETVGNGRQSQQVLGERRGDRERVAPFAEIDVASDRERGAPEAVGNLQLGHVDDALGSALGRQAEGQIAERILGHQVLRDAVHLDVLRGLDSRILEVAHECEDALVVNPVEVDVVHPEIKVQGPDLELALQCPAGASDAHDTVPGEGRSQDCGIALGPVEVSDPQVSRPHGCGRLRGLGLEGDGPVRGDGGHDCRRRSRGLRARPPSARGRRLRARERARPEARAGRGPRGCRRCRTPRRAAWRRTTGTPRASWSRGPRWQASNCNDLALAIHGGLERHVVVARGTAGEREARHAEVHLGLVPEHGPLGFEGQHERPRGDAGVRRVLYPQLGRVPDEG